MSIDIVSLGNHHLAGENAGCAGADWTDQGLWFSALSALSSRVSPLMLSTLSAPSTTEFIKALSVLDWLGERVLF